MKKQLLKLGKALSKAEQRNVFGGSNLENPGCWERGKMDNGCNCNYNTDCTSGYCYGSGAIGICKDKPA